MRRRITTSLITIAMISILIVIFLGMVFLHANYTSEAKIRLKDEAVFVSASLMQAADPISYLRETDPNPGYGGRMTYIRADGEVLYDTYMQAGVDLGNHGDRPEVRDALAHGEGQSVRYSQLEGIDTIYQALLLPNGNVLRLSISKQNIRQSIIRLIPADLIGIGTALILSILLARYLTRRIVAPINALDLDAPLREVAYDELLPLLTRIDRQNQQIYEDMEQLEEQQRRFNAVVDHMQEGLILLDAGQHAFIINRSARQHFHASAESLGRHILEINDSAAMRGLMLRATAEKYCDAIYAQEETGKEFFIMCNPVRESGPLLGFVLIILDITFARETERMRREFSSNVSHELKTPLTSISGYAEIMMNGIAKEEDMRRFARRIHEECARLRDLIDGVMLLSQLDESGDALPFEDVKLLSLVRQEVDKLQPLALQHDVDIQLSGTPVSMRAIPHLMEEMVRNLVENGILYNRPGGKVFVRVTDLGDHATLTVADTGIGILEEAQSRVFERFFRTERSRSKHSGGTGLGLAIVKHCARLHGAEITLESKEGVGTTIQVLFNKLDHNRYQGN